MDKEQEKFNLDIWNEYQKGVSYNNLKMLFNLSDENHNFYHGIQWNGTDLGDVKPVCKNICKPIVKYKTGTIIKNSYEFVYIANTFNLTNEKREELKVLLNGLNGFTQKNWEKTQAGKFVKLAIKDSAIDSEGIIHRYFDKDSNLIYSELIDKCNIYYGNENDSNIQNQPYIIIAFRRDIKTVREIAEKNGVQENKIKLILPDNNTNEQANQRDAQYEVNDKCTVLLKYWKENGTVKYKKCTQYVVLEEGDTQLSRYPVAHFVWEEVKNSARGLGEIEANKANQIELNKLVVRRLIASKIFSLPKLVVNKKFIPNGKALRKVDSTIEIDGTGVDDVNKIVRYLTPANMSPDVTNLTSEIQNDTQQLAGAGDYAQGNIKNSSNISGRTLIALQESAEQPLNDQLDAFRYFLEDLALIELDMLRVYYKNGINVVVKNKEDDGSYTEQEVLIPIEKINDLNLSIKVEITRRGAFDIMSQEQDWMNLFASGKITLDEYVEGLDEDSRMQKLKLQRIIEQRKKNQEQIQAINSQMEDLANQVEQKITFDEMNGYNNKVVN